MEKRYKETEEYLIKDFPMYSKEGASAYRPGLERTLELAAMFDNPHKKFRAIHVAGTNGKGSTCHLIASVLQSQGYKVGLYTSPHILDFRERMRINGRMIPKEKVVDFMDKWQAMNSDLAPSFFEITTIMAFKWFAEEKVDFAMVEVGLGGRHDSTNIISPEVSIITNISLDHTQILGDTPKEIAREKAGIIKAGVPVVIGEKTEETEKVFVEKAKEVGAEIYFTQAGESNTQLQLNGKSLRERGDYQEKNLNTALTALEVLRQRGVVISDESIRIGVENMEALTGLTGRWMIVENSPLTIVDGGHNPGGLEINFRQLERMIEERPGATLRIVVGFMADKAVDDIIKLMPPVGVYYPVKADIPRAMDAEVLAEKLAGLKVKPGGCGNVWEGYRRAKEEASPQDIIYVGGSFSVVAEFLKYFKGN